MQEIQHILFGQLLFLLVFLPYSTCCQKRCSTVFYSFFCKVLRKSKHPCCRLRLTWLFFWRFVLSASSFIPLSSPQRWGCMISDGEVREDRWRKEGKEEERADLFSLSVCGPVRHLSHCFLMLCPSLHLSAAPFLCLCVHSCVCVCGQNCEFMLKLLSFWVTCCVWFLQWVIL